MTHHRTHRKAGIGRIGTRLASSVLSGLAILSFLAGIAASTQVHAMPIAKPVSFITDEIQHGAVTAGRSGHRLCRSPIRFFGTAEGRQLPGCKSQQG